MSSGSPIPTRIPMLTFHICWQQQADKILLLASLVALLIGILVIEAHHLRSGIAALSVCDGFTYWRWVRAWRRRRMWRQFVR